MNYSIGTLIYSNDPYKLIVSVDNDIGKFYRSMIPKYFNVKIPLYDSHISVVRKEIPIKMEFWKKYHGKEIEFEYESFIYNDNVYWWLNAYSPILEDIRLELGLPICSEFTKSPNGAHRFHITIGNNK